MVQGEVGPVSWLLEIELQTEVLVVVLMKITFWLNFSIIYVITYYSIIYVITYYSSEYDTLVYLKL